MTSRKLIKTLTAAFVLVLVSLFNSNNVYAQDVCDDEGFIKGTWCPCPPEPSLASVCGLVSDANLTAGSIDLEDGTSHPAWSTREPVSGVTVSIYENTPDVSTGKIFGKLENKFLECVTSDVEGKYHCLMRRLNPGNLVYVIFSCEGTIADIKIVSSVRSITSLDADIDCSGEYEYQTLRQDGEEEDVIDFAQREEFLGCRSTYEDEVNQNAGFEEPEHEFMSTTIGEKGGDIRFNDRDGDIAGLIGGHPGALWEKDCLIEYDRTNNLRRQYTLAGGWLVDGFDSVQEKCNFDPDMDGDGEIDRDDGNPLDDPDELTIPFRYDIPTLELEHEQVRVWETRTSFQREMQDPRAFAQYNHLMFGDCIGKVHLRYYEDTEEDQPIPCAALATCNETLGNPIRNIHTSLSFGSRLASPMTWEELVMTEERPLDDVVCRHPTLGDVTIAEIQPPNTTESCEPGTSGCRYKLSSDYYMPQYFIMTGGVKKPKTSETIGDAYGSVPRSEPWEAVATEAEIPHEGGHYVNYEDATAHKNNSGMTAIRIANEGEGNTDGVMVNRFVSFADALEGDYNYEASSIIWDAGGDIKSLCSISGVNAAINGSFIISDALTEAITVVNNVFKGVEEDHDPVEGDESAATATYATEWGVNRDMHLNRVSYIGRDIFDTLQRFASGGGVLQLLDLESINAIVTTVISRGSDNDYKSFAERIDNFTFNGAYSYMNAKYCLAEDTFDSHFPPYGIGDYPGNSSCYPWADVPLGGFCYKWPGRPQDWGTTYGLISGASPALISHTGAPYDGTWPGITGELRTCKLERCQVWEKTRTCDEFLWRLIFDPTSPTGFRSEETDICWDWNGDGDIETRIIENKRVCRTTPDIWRYGQLWSEYELCLVEQEDTWEREPRNPSDLPAPGFPDQHSSERNCDLQKAGPMTEPGDIYKDHMTRIIQEPFWDETQKNTERVSKSANYTALALLSPIEDRTEFNKASFVDYATTNDINHNDADDGGYDSSGQMQGGEYGSVHRTTAGELSQGFGTGATVGLLKIISHPERPGTMTEPFPPMYPNCNYFDPNAWCYAIEPPGPIDLDSLDGGQCNANTSGSCPLEITIGPLAQRILGAAGARSGVPGSLLLAAIQGEGGWFTRMDWDDRSIASYSEPWSARMPHCNDMVTGAQGPFGLITTWFDDAVLDGGHHPSRVSPTDGSTLVYSKCNFIDAAYGAAKMLSYSYGGSCSSVPEGDVIAALTQYRGGTPPTSFMVDIALHCRGN